MQILKIRVEDTSAYDDDATINRRGRRCRTMGGDVENSSTKRMEECFRIWMVEGGFVGRKQGGVIW